MSSQSSIGEKIAELRKKKGFTQADVGVYLNISYQAVSKWERGESFPDFNTLSRLAQLFGVPISYFEDSTPTAVEASAVETPAAPVEAEPLNGEMLGVCKTCGKVVRKGEEGKTAPVLVCKACVEAQKRIAAAKAEAAKREEEKKKKEEEYARLVKLEDARRRRYLSFVVAGIVSGVLAVTFLFVGLTYWGNGLGFFLSSVACSVIFSGFAFTYVSQLFWGGAVVDCTLFGGHVIGTPGIIFDLSLEGLGFLIAVKILFAVLRFTIYILTVLAGVVAAILISPFTFFPALQRVNSGDLGI